MYSNNYWMEGQLLDSRGSEEDCMHITALVCDAVLTFSS